MHNRVVAEIAKLLSRNGVVTIVAVIAPYKAWGEYARKEIGEFVEVYLKCPLEVRIKRDPKGFVLQSFER